MKVITTAPGKVILHGEHAVVHGKTAVATSVDLRTTLTLTPAHDTDTISLTLASFDIDVTIPLALVPHAAVAGPKVTRAQPQESTSSKDAADPDAVSPRLASLLPREDIDMDVLEKVKALVMECCHRGPGIEEQSRDLAVEAFMYLYCEIVQVHDPRDHGVSVVIKSDLPIGAGLGSSAAFSVCLASAMLGYIGGLKKIEAVEEYELVNAWALVAEKIIHGNPSGLDNTMCCYGGAMSYTKGKFQHIDSFPELDVILINTKIPRSTKTLVAGVGDLLELMPTVVNPLLNSMEAITNECLKTCAKMNDDNEATETQELFKCLSALVRINHSLLNAIGVGHVELDKVIGVSATEGFAAKLTGAGGGGCAFVLIPKGAASPRFCLNLFCASRNQPLAQNYPLIQHQRWLGSDPTNLLKRLKSEFGYDYWRTHLGVPGVDMQLVTMDG